jgi:hypothetical protein
MTPQSHRRRSLADLTSRRPRIRAALFTLAALAFPSVAAVPAVLADAPETSATPPPPDASTSWRVTIENLTPPGPGAPGSQPFSPPLFVVHSSQMHVWRAGEIANHATAAIIEDANNALAESVYTGFPGVRQVFTGAGGPIPSGASRTYTVQTQGSFHRLSILTMLVNTNDGFTGLDALSLFGQRRVVTTMAYDGGSEKNNQLKSHVPGSCCGNFFVRDPEGALIRPHAGIQPNTGDLTPAKYGWREPVARITAERVP